ncbi:AAA family ATPase [Burkholderia ubonensis]|uniref:AAA family ATPase n=1 Tax=Burkholderia ubonensis TaxID=101571 RepID=UPI0009B2F212|nr:ATP/GTP-binding protein [Burkholderia ubonensis]
MLVSFSVSNFRSIREEITLSLVASKRLSIGDDSHEDHTVEIPDSDERVLRAAVIYGANGAGKSNLFRALKYCRRLAVATRSKANVGTSRQPFKFGKLSDATSTFDVRFIANERLYRIFFRVDDDRILEEYLVREQRGREALIYERVTSEQGQVKVELGPSLDRNAKLQALATVGGPQNQTFLASVLANLDKDEIGDDLSSVLNWCDNSLNLIGPDQDIAPMGALLDISADFTSFASDFLNKASTGVDHLVVEKKDLTEEELRALLPASVFSSAMEKLRKDGEEFIFLRSPINGAEYALEKGEADKFYKFSVEAAHVCAAGDIVSLDLSEESDGTKRLLNLLPAITPVGQEEDVYFIDEIDRSLHPILIWNFIKEFLKSQKKNRHQVIVTTHDTILLDQDLLRRDEIWFVEKDAALGTNVYSLAEFQVRKDLQLRKHYLSGRFGAIPFPGSLDRLTRREG